MDTMGDSTDSRTASEAVPGTTSGMHVTIHQDDGWHVWAALEPGRYPWTRRDSFIIGSGDTRDGAVADAVAELEATIDALQAAPAPADLPTVRTVRGGLFKSGNDYLLASGQRSAFKIDCDALTDDDVATLAELVVMEVGAFGAVEGVPRGGLRLAAALRPFATEGPLLIVDDVLTTGGSIERHRHGRDAVGAVIFARGPEPLWVRPVFRTGGRLWLPIGSGATAPAVVAPVGISDDRPRASDLSSFEAVPVARLDQGWQDIAREFIKWNLKNGGCSNCGGLPHTTTCVVGRFEAILPLPPTRGGA